MVDPDLRLELQRITEKCERSEHVRLIKDLSTRHIHRIEPAVDGDLADLRPDQYTCFMHTFGLARAPAVLKIAGEIEDIYPSREFVSCLIAKDLALRSNSSSREGDVVIYFGKNGISHAGRVRGDRVLSKWGTGHLWLHPLLEVPLNYGSETAFYEPITQSQAKDAFVRYAVCRVGKSQIEQVLDRKLP